MDSKSPATQVIDQYLIDLLGLQDEYELNWEDYFRSLREASIAARMSNTRYTSDQARLITDELKRVKSEDKSTVFTTGVKKKKVNKTKVNASKVTSISNFVQKQRKNPAANIKPVQNLLPPSFEQKETPQKLLPQSQKENISTPTGKKGERISLIKLLQSIDKTLVSILKTLEEGFKFDQKTSEEDRKSRERGRRSESEKRLEGGLGKGLKTIIGAASKALSPLQDVFDRIKNFIVWVLLGKAFNMFLKWFSDPANQKTFNTILKFLSDHWILLVGSYLAFGTSIGRLVTGLIGKLAGFTIKMGIVIAQKLLPLIGKMGGKGKLALLAAGGLAVAGAARALGGKKNTEVEPPSKEETAPIPKPETPSTSGYAKGGLISSEKSFPSEKKGKEFGLPIPLELLLGGPAYLPFFAAKKGLENFDSIKETGLSATKKASKFNPISLLANQFGAFKKDKNQKSSVPKFESGGVVGEENKKSFPLLEALKYSPLGLVFQAGKFGAENLGKAVSGGAGLVGKGLELGGKASKKALELSPLGLAFKAGKFGAENLGKAVSGAAGLAGKAFSGFGKAASGAGDLVKSGIKNTVKLSTLPLTVGLSGLKGASDIVKGTILKNPKIQSELDKLSKQAKTTGLDKDSKFIALGGIGGLASIVAEKSGPLISKQVKNQNSQTKTGGFTSGGVIGTDLTNGIPITGAGKDNTLIKAKTGDAVLTEKDQSVLSKAISGGGPFGSLMGGGISSGIGLLGNKNREDTTIAVRKGEAILTPEHQTSIFEKFGINIPEWLSGRKPNKVDSDKIKTKSGVGFSNGGIVRGYASGGIVGGTSVLNLGKKISGDPDHKFDPTLAQSIPLLYRMLQSGRFKEKGWGDKKFLDQLTARLLVESANFSRAKEMYNSDPRDPKGKEGYQYFSGYSGMIGNKNADDAYNFRGRGAIQLTGRDNYEGFNKWLAKNGHKGIDVTKNPDLLSKDPKIQALSTIYYLENREKTFGVNFADMARKGDSKSFTYNINGGYNHLAETQDNLRRIQGLSGGVNYGKGFSPVAPRSKVAPAPRNPIMNIASRAMSTIGNIFSPPASAAPKPAAPKPAAPKPAAPEPKRWAIDPRGWIGKQSGGSIQKKASGGIVKKITSGIGGFFNKNKKRDIAKGAIKKTTAKGTDIKSGVSTITGKKSPSENQKKGFWGNISNTISGIQSGVTTTKEALKKGKYLKSAANFVGGIPQKISNKVTKQVSNIGSAIAKNPKMMKIGGAFGKFGGRMVPGLGVAASAADAAARAERGDKFGAALAGFGAASGATTLATSGASLTGVGAAIPAIAEAASMVSDVALLGKDIWDISTSKDSANKKKDTDEKNKKQMGRLYKDTLTSKVAGMQGGGLVNFGGGRVNIANPEKYYQNQLESMLGSQFGINLSTPQSRPDSIQPFQQFRSGLGSLGERARNIFSPLTNLFGGRRNQASPQPQSAPIAPTLPQITPVITAAPSPPQVIPAPPKSVQPSPSTLLAPVKKSIMQQQADELRAMRANSLERQGKGADAYGLRAFGTGKDFSSFFAKGMVMENTGFNMPGGTADRQLTALQPGEYVIPKDTVDRVGKGFLDSIVGSTDSNSAASKIGVKSNNVGNKIKPYTSGDGFPTIVTLPPITENSSSKQTSGGPGAAGQKELSFSPICSNKSALVERKRILDTLGFINHI